MEFISTLFTAFLLQILSVTYGAVVLNEGFENMTTISGTWEEKYPNCKGTSTGSIDTSQAHGGKNSLKINGAFGYCNHIWVGSSLDLSSVGSTWYFRMFIRHTTALGPNHVAFIAMKDANDQNKDIRIGGQNKMLQWNRENDDATLPTQSPQGVAKSVPLPTGKWVCFEYMIGSDGTAQTWVDGTEVAGLHAGAKVAEIDQGWLANSWKPKLVDVRVGWESYGDGTDTLWFDDIAIGSSKIGC